MQENHRVIIERACDIATGFDRAYKQWAESNKDQLPELFVQGENSEPELSKPHRLAARLGFVLMSYTTQEIWSLAGDIVGHDIDEDDARANDSFMHLTSMDFLPAEVARQCYGSTRILMYQAIAHAGQKDRTEDVITSDELNKAVLDVFSCDRPVWSKLSMFMHERFGIGAVPKEAAYVHLKHRRAVFKRLLALLLNSVENFQMADDTFKLLEYNHNSCATFTAINAFKAMAATRPCPAPGCEMHQFHHEHPKV